MTISLRQKILAIFLILTVVIIIATSGVYYYLIIKDIRDLSQKQITSAFEIMFDAFRSQAKQTLPRIDNFVNESLMPPLNFMYRDADEAKITWDDELDTQDWIYIQRYLMRLRGITDAVERFAPLLGFQYFAFYDTGQKVIAVYCGDSEKELLGTYLHEFHGGTLIPLDTEIWETTISRVQGINELPHISLPEGIPATYEDEIPDTATATISTLSGITTIKYTVPVFQEGKFYGVGILHIPILQSEAERYSHLSQTAINIFAEGGLSVGVLPEYHDISIGDATLGHHIALLQLQELPPIEFTKVTTGNQEYYQGKMLFHDQEGQTGAITANFARTIEAEKAKELFSLIALVTLIIGAFTTVAAYLLSSRIANPITHISKLLYLITEGDLTGVIHDPTYAEQKKRPGIMKKRRLQISDEIEMLSRSFYAMVTYLRDMTEIAKNISLGEISQSIAPRSERDVLGNAFSQMIAYLHDMATLAAAIAEGDLTKALSSRSDLDAFGRTMRKMTIGLTLLIQQIKTSAEQIASTGTAIVALSEKDTQLVQNIQESVADMVSTMMDMGNSVEDVAQNMDFLSSAVEQTFNSVSKTTDSMSDIASSTRNLEKQTKQMITNLNQAVQMLTGLTEQTSVSRQLSQETIQDARAGQQAVEEVRESMDAIQQTVLNAEETITRFAHRSQEIGTILEVINDITEQSRLLALNASIIAAQAGSHGRGFSVIAEEMRNLAIEVQASAKNIAEIVRTLQEETNAVVQMIHDGAGKIGEGVSRTQQAQARLQKIMASAERSSGVVAEIGDALNTQMNVSHEVEDIMEQVHNMTIEITNATNVQRMSTLQIQDAVEHISELANQTQQATTEQLGGVKLVLDASELVRILTGQNLESSQEINRATRDNLAEQAKILLKVVDRFRLQR